MWIVELEHGVYISSFGRTIVRYSAKEYKTERGAKIALGLVRKFREFPKARILKSKY